MTCTGTSGRNSDAGSERGDTGEGSPTGCVAGADKYDCGGNPVASGGGPGGGANVGSDVAIWYPRAGRGPAGGANIGGATFDSDEGEKGSSIASKRPICDAWLESPSSLPIFSASTPSVHHSTAQQTY